MLEKKRVLRKIEFTLTNDEMHPVCHCHYEDVVLEDGKIIMKKNHREIADAKIMRQWMMNRKEYMLPNENRVP